MGTINKISSLIGQQLPDFVRADYPKFQRFIELYYQWLEDPEGGNTVFHIMESGKYRDIDETLDPFVSKFKEELLPYFPEKTALDIKKILKRAREFYIQKGSEESVKWLFRVLFDQEVELFYPKKQILKASDGKWKLPLAFRLTLSTENEDIDPNLLEKLKGEGSISTATCVIESANKTIDKNFGNEVLEIYVSNVSKEFVNGEFLVIKGVEGYSNTNPFKEKIIGSLSTIKIDSNINTDPLQKRRGLFYNVGDPVIVFGGLNNTPEARDAVAYVEDVSQGSIEGITVTFPGYGYREYPNAITTVLRTVGVDDPNANASASVLLTQIDTTNVAGSSQQTFQEYINVDKMPIEYLGSVTLSTANYSLFTQNNRNVVLNITENQNATLYADDFVYANGDSLSTANFVGKILNTTNLTAGVAADVMFYSVANTRALTTTGFLVGVDKLFVPNSAIVINVNSVVNSTVSANINSRIKQTLNYQTLETGGASYFQIVNGGYGFRVVPRIDVSTFHDTFWSEAELVGSTFTDPDYQATRQGIGNYGRIAHVYIDSAGSNYANGDQIVVSGRGYGFVGNVTVNSTGSIIATRVLDRGEGYYGPKTVSVTSSLGSNAVLSAYGFGEGVEYAIDTGAIGRIKTIKLVNRGYDYVTAPLVSLKVMDMVVNFIPENDREKVTEGYFIYQGSLDSPSFTSIIKSYSAATNLLRTFNYSGSFDNFSTIRCAKTILDENGNEVDVDLGTVTINLSGAVPTPEQYPPGTVLGNPVFYGNGRARAIAEFFNGLIKFTGFYLNTDGFLSADKKTQDNRVYHNYSYVIQSEKSLSDYESIIKDVVHPIGTSMLSKTITYNQIGNGVGTDSYLYLNPPVLANSNVQVSNSYSNVITGNNTTFGANLIGNLIYVIDQTNPQRSFAKIITGRTSDTSINVEGNFIKTGEGYLSTESQNTANTEVVATVYGRYIEQIGRVTVSDLNRRVISSNTLLNGRATVNTTTAVVTGNSTTLLSDLSSGDLVNIDGQIKVVVSVSSNSSVTVNSAFASNATNKKIFKLSSNLSTFNAGDLIIVQEEERLISSVVTPEFLLVSSAFNKKGFAVPYYKANTDTNTSVIFRTSGKIITSNISVNDVVTLNNETKRVIRIIDSDRALTNTPFKYTAASQNVFKLYDTTLTVTKNTNPVVDSIAVGDTIKISLINYEDYSRVVGSSNLSANIVSGSNISLIGSGSENFASYIAVNDIISINNDIRTVVSVAAGNIKVDVPFTSTANQLYLYKKITTLDLNVRSVTTSSIGTNLNITLANTSDLVYFIVPDYSKRDYTYSITKLAD